MTSATTQRPRARSVGRVGLYVQDLHQLGDLPVFSPQLLDLLTLSTDEPSGVRRLVKIVAEDYALTCKVLQIANSYYYNRSNQRIETLPHAIFVLGTDRVRNLASTLLCLQTSTRHSTGVRRLMIRSIMSAHVARQTAQLGQSVDPNVAYLAGMLRNLGEVLVAHYTPSHHSAIEKRVEEGVSRNVASMKELGFTFTALAQVAGRDWRLSSRLCAIWEDPSTSTVDLTWLARFADELTRVTCQRTVARRHAEMKLLWLRYGGTLRLAEDRIADVWSRALTDARDTFHGALSELGIDEQQLNG